MPFKPLFSLPSNAGMHLQKTTTIKKNLYQVFGSTDSHAGVVYGSLESEILTDSALVKPATDQAVAVLLVQFCYQVHSQFREIAGRHSLSKAGVHHSNRRGMSIGHHPPTRDFLPCQPLLHTGNASRNRNNETPSHENNSRLWGTQPRRYPPGFVLQHGLGVCIRLQPNIQPNQALLA